MYDYEISPQGAELNFELKNDKRVRHLLNAIKKKKNPRILEVGVGQGGFLKKVIKLRNDLDIYGIDISAISITSLKQRKEINGFFSVGDAENLDFDDEYFDVVFMVDVLEHIPNPSLALLEVKRVLKPNGVFHIYFPCEGEPKTLDYFIQKYNLFGLKDFTRVQFGHLHYLSQQELFDMLESILTIKSICYSNNIISQIVLLFTLYLPKQIISKYLPGAHLRVRDGYIGDNKKNSYLYKLLFMLKNAWVSLILFPASVIYEIDAFIFQKIRHSSQGVHITCIKHPEN